VEEVKNKGMRNSNYPALFRSADLASADAQNSYLLLIRIHSVLLILSAGFSVYGINNKGSAIFSALVIISAIFVSLLIILKKDEDRWYRTRAVAESVKTSTWKFMMKAEPFTDEKNKKVVKSEFLGRLKNILDEHKNLSHELGDENSSEKQITSSMLKIRDMPLNDRIDFYRKNRIDEQRKWYAKKASDAKKQSCFWFSLLIICQLIAIAFIIFRVAYPNFGYWPAEIFVVSASVVLTWIQIKRFRELASAYGLTAHELGFIRGELDSVENEKDFIQFVINSETAFSREHTQWLARKNVI